jgi:hypothetical protein
MPLLDGKAFQADEAKLAVLIGDSKERFHIEYTGEVFDDYTQYAAALQLYQQPRWSTAQGETGLTFEQALALETKAKTLAKEVRPTPIYFLSSAALSAGRDYGHG